MRGLYIVKLILLILLVGIFLFNVVGADGDIGFVKQNDCIDLYNYCPTCSYIHLTAIQYPNQTLSDMDITMTKTNNNYVYNFCDTGNLGGYSYTTCGDKAGVLTCEDMSFESTVTGKEMTSAKATSYVIVLIISILIFFGLLWMGIGLPSKNKSDEYTGYIIALSNLKYLKYVFLGIAYITLVWISYFSWMIVYAYLDFDFLSTIFRFMFTFLAIATLPLFILFVWIIISNIVHDNKIGDYLMRGLRVK